MALTKEVDTIFSDALTLQSQAVERFNAGDVRDGAEKAWCAARRATDAMILSATNKEPRSSGKTMEVLRRLYRYDDAVFKYVHTSYTSYQTSLHGNCFYDGNCGPPEFFGSEIEDTLYYINYLKTVAASYPPGSIELKGWND